MIQSRRDFIKFLALIGASTVTGKILKDLPLAYTNTFQESSQESPIGYGKLYKSVHAPNCWQSCRVNVYVNNGKITKIERGEFPNPRYNRICLRGISHIHQVYHPDRLKYPLKRVGKRGDGKFIRISWEEAIEEISQQLTRIREKYGSRAVLFAPTSGDYGLVNGAFTGAVQIFANLFQGTIGGGALDSALPLGMSQVLANVPGYTTAFYEGNEGQDIADNARLILVWGANVTESQIQTWHFIADAIENGAKLIVIDPRLSIIAAKADVWIRPKFGTDPALALSMINVIIENNLYDKEFVLNHTVAPFLVRLDNGMFLREKDLLSNGSDAYMVWDNAMNDVVPLHAVKDSLSLALFGEYVINGIKCKTAFQLLREEAAKYAPEVAEKITGVPKELIVEVAKMYATRKPATIYPGFGLDRWDNGHLSGRCLATLAAITGNVGKPGASVSGVLGGAALTVALKNSWKWVAPTWTWATTLNYLLVYDAITKGEVEMYIPKDPNNPLLGTTGAKPERIPYIIKAAIITNSNFVSTFPNQNKIINELFSEDKLEFIVVIDQFMTDTAQYADIVLPATTCYENFDIVAGMHPYLMVRERAINPMYECKSDWQIFKMLAEKMGFGKYFNMTEEEMADKIVRLLLEDFGDYAEEAYNKFKKDGVIRLTKEPYIGFEGGKFLTPSGRAEFYAERVLVNFPFTYPALGIPVNYGVNPLPHFIPPAEAWDEYETKKKYPLVYIQEHSRWRVHSQFFNTELLRELDPEQYVELNELDAMSRGIREGDIVEVFNDRGALVAKARINNRIPPGSVFIQKGWQRSQSIKGSYQELTANHKNSITLNCSFFDTLVDIRKVD